MTESYDTIVIGLGASGVTALSTLARHGKRVLGLEADSRIGGRVHTVEFGDGVVELGAEWIHGTEKSKVHDIAVANKIDLIPQSVQFKVYHSDGSAGDVELIDELVGVCLSAVAEPPTVPERLGQFTTKKCREYLSKHKPDLLKNEEFLQEFFDFMNLYTDNYEASDDWDDVTTDSHYTELEGEQHVSWHRNGYNTLFQLLMNTYKNNPGVPPATLLFNKEVVRINWSKEPDMRVVVNCADGSQYEADNVIVTVSLGVLKYRYSTLFNPSLPQEKIDAIKNIEIGVMDKIILSFDTKWWPTDKTFFGFIWRRKDKERIAKECFWMTRIFGCSRPLGTSNCITLWTSGEVGKMVETLPAAEVKSRCEQLLRMFMGADRHIPDATGMIRSTWHTNPFTRGSYSHDAFASKNCPQSRIVLASPIKNYLGKPVVLFAGEATHTKNFSTVHGAMDTGYREAMHLVKVNSKI